jgi:hypothetical protein
MNGRHQDKKDNTGDAFVNAITQTLSHESGSIGAVLNQLALFANQYALLNSVQKGFVKSG